MDSHESLGAARRPRVFSAHRVARMLRCARQYATKYGKDINDILLSMIYGQDLDGREVKVSALDRLECIRLFKECTMARIVEGGEVDRLLGQDRSLFEDTPNLAPISG